MHARLRSPRHHAAGELNPALPSDWDESEYCALLETVGVYVALEG